MSAEQDGNQDLRGRPDDVTRRTHLANGRTYLAWWRSGLASIGLAVAVGSLLPQLADGGEGRGDLAFVGVGAGFGLLGVLAVLYGAARERAVSRAIARGRYAPLPSRGAIALAVAAAALGIAAIVLVVVGA